MWISQVKDLLPDHSLSKDTHLTNTLILSTHSSYQHIILINLLLCLAWFCPLTAPGSIELEDEEETTSRFEDEGKGRSATFAPTSASCVAKVNLLYPLLFINPDSVYWTPILCITPDSVYQPSNG